MAKRQEDDAGINLTPMIDVVFQLLTFFMMCNDMSMAEIDILDLPKIKHGATDKMAVKDPPLIINIRPDGTVVIYSRPHNFAAMRKALMKERISHENPVDQTCDRAVRVRADKKTPYRFVQRVMVACMRERVWKLSFGAFPPPKEEM